MPPRITPLRSSKPLREVGSVERRLGSGKARLSPVGALTSRRSLRKNTPSRAAEERKLAKRRPVWLDGQVCAWCGIGPPLQLHHMRGRVGADLLDDAHWLALCAEHHAYVTEHPMWAKANGYSEDRNGHRGDVA